MSQIENAVQYAVFAHAGMKRKGKERPYILHPLEVLSIVGTMTEDEEVLAAAVLHDTVEDTSLTCEDIRRVYGSRVAELVASESENKRKNQSAESTWKLRKQETIDHLQSADMDVKLICLGDKLTNLREIARAYDEFREGVYGDKAGIYCESKIFDSVEFGYHKIVVERPQRDENGEIIRKRGKPLSAAGQ